MIMETGNIHIIRLCSSVQRTQNKPNSLYPLRIKLGSITFLVKLPQPFMPDNCYHLNANVT